MQDRLQDLYNIRTNVDIGKEYSEAEMIEVPIDSERIEVPEGLQEFTGRVDKIKSEITDLRANIDSLSNGYRLILLATTNSKTQDDQMNELEKKIEDSLRIIAEALKSMSADSQETSTLHGRWKSNVHSHLTKRFMDVLIQYRHIQSDHKEKVQARIRQRLQIVKPDATAEEIEQAVGSGRLNVFSQQLRDEGQAQDTLRYVEGRHRELLKIEESVNELHQLFVDMAALVNAQGEYIDNIESNVAQSSEFVEQANKDLTGALRRKNRNRKCAFISCIIIMVLIAIAVITVLLVGKSQGWFLNPLK